MDTGKNAIVIANMRSGSTFLISCLGSHSEIEAFDGEILLPGSKWHRDRDTDVAIMQRYYDQDYPVVAAKVTYVQVNQDILGFVEDRGLKIIHLTRGDAVRWAFSAVTNRYTNDSRYKHFKAGMERPEMPRFEVSVRRFLTLVANCKQNQRAVSGVLGNMSNELLHLEYEDLVGREGNSATGLSEEVGGAICEFLEIPYEPMTSDRRKSAVWPMSEVIINWDELKAAIGEAGYEA